jgi:hypothetical protein
MPRVAVSFRKLPEKDGKGQKGLPKVLPVWKLAPLILK